MTFAIKGGGLSSAVMLFSATETGVFLVQKYCFKSFIVCFENGKSATKRGGEGPTLIGKSSFPKMKLHGIVFYAIFHTL